MSTLPYLGANVRPASVDELKYRGLLEEDETLLALFDGIILDERSQRVGGLALSDFVALTDRGVLLWVRGFWHDTVDHFAWQDVDVAESGTWGPFHGRVRLGLRLPAPEVRQKRIKIKGVEADESGERVIINTLDYMPAEDVPVLTKMVEWVGDQVVAGVERDELLALFGEQFPQPERVRLVPRTFQAPPPEPEPAQESSKSWWAFGRNRQKRQDSGTPEGLVAAYERERYGTTGQRTRTSPATYGSGTSPNMPMPEQPSLHEVTRGLRLLLDAPYRMKGTVVRANQIVSGTNEFLENMQDSEVRRRAVAGLRMALDQQERQQGPLGSTMASAARAVLRFGERIVQPRDEEGSEEVPATRSIEVRAAVRQRDASAPAPVSNGSRAVSPEQPEPVDAPEARSVAPVVRSSAGVRRKIDVRAANGKPANGKRGPVEVAVEKERSAPAESVAPQADAPGEAEAPAASELPVIAPVRRIVISRSE